MAIEHLVIKFRPPDRNMDIILNDIRFAVNQTIDVANSGTLTDKFVGVGAAGTPDYLSSSYFARTIASHITIKNYYNTTTPLAGGGDLSAIRTLSLAGLTTLGTANYIVGANAGATAWEYKAATAGTGIGIAHAAGAITFSLSHLGIQSLTDPNADRIFFWDDSEGTSAWLTPTNALSITTAALNVLYDGTTIGLNGSNQLYAILGGLTHEILSATHSDSAVGSVARGDIITGQSATPKWTRLAKGTSGYFLKSSADDAVWAAHGLTYSDVGADISGAATTAVSGHESTYNHANYNTAYGWGNHASAGYLTAVTAHQLDSATYHTVSGLTAGHFLKALSATTFGFAAHGLTHDDVGALGATDKADDSDKWDSYQFADYLDQAVKTTSTPQFARLGIGVASENISMVYMGGTFDSGAADAQGLRGDPTLAPGNARSAYFAYFGGAVSVPNGETVANAVGFRIIPITKTGAGTLTNAYGFYCQVPTGGIVNTCAYFDGPVGIGITNPAYKFQITGAIAGWAAVINVEGTQALGLYTTGTTNSIYAVGPAYFSSSVYGEGNCSMLSFTDRTPYPKNKQEAYDSVLSLQGNNGKLDHKKLHDFVRHESKKKLPGSDIEEVIIGRNLSALVSAQNEVIKDLLVRIEALEEKK